MDENTKRKYELLKKKQQEDLNSKQWRNNEFFCDYIDKLFEKEILSETRAKEIIRNFSKLYPISIGGHIDAKNMNVKRINLSYEQLANYLCLDDYYYIIGDDISIPIVKSKLIYLIQNIDDLEAISFSFIMISEDMNIVLESNKFGYIFYYPPYMN